MQLHLITQDSALVTSSAIHHRSTIASLQHTPPTERTQDSPRDTDKGTSIALSGIDAAGKTHAAHNIRRITADIGSAD